jgi:hypothetical protein
MTPRIYTAVALLLGFGWSTAQAYNSNQSSHSCDKPMYFDYQPSPSKYNQSFSEFSFVASSNTNPHSINVEISVGGGKILFTPQDLIITNRANGQFEVHGKLDRAMEHGFARINITSHSKPNCEKTDGFLVRVH